MRYFLLCAFTLSLALAANAQSNVINNFAKKYQDTEMVTHLNLTGNLLNIILNSKDENGEQNFMSRLDALRVISIEDRSIVAADDLSALRQGIQANNYEELIQVRDGKDLIYIYLMENKEQVIEELIILVEDPEEFTLVSLSGALHYEELKSLEIDGQPGDALQNLPDRGQPRP